MYKIDIPSEVNTIYIHPTHENPRILAAKLSTIFFGINDFGTCFYYIMASTDLLFSTGKRFCLIIKIYKGME
jgi:hypothetical protein